jgi:hypothetical protein
MGHFALQAPERIAIVLFLAEAALVVLFYGSDAKKLSRSARAKVFLLSIFLAVSAGFVFLYPPAPAREVIITGDLPPFPVSSFPHGFRANRAACVRKLEAFYGAVEPIINRRLPFGTGQRGINAWTTEANQWTLTTAKWIKKNLGPAAFSKFGDRSHESSTHWARALTTDQDSTINLLNVEKANLSDIIASLECSSILKLNATCFCGGQKGQRKQKKVGAQNSVGGGARRSRLVLRFTSNQSRTPDNGPLMKLNRRGGGRRITQSREFYTDSEFRMTHDDCGHAAKCDLLANIRPRLSF